MTSALLPALDYTISRYGGSVTEYLGDGVLAFFRVDAQDNGKTIKQAYRAAKACIEITRKSLNSIMHDRYNLEEMDIGVGLAISKAIVSCLGHGNNFHPKAFGECVFMATKLSAGTNEIIVDDKLNSRWPQSENGTLSFTKKTINKNEGYIVR